MGKRSKKQEVSRWAWVCRWQFDSMGIGRWFPHHNVDTPRQAKITVRALTRDGGSPHQWRVEAPGHDRDADYAEQNRRAAEGICPSCGAKPKHAKKGRSNGYIAFKCGKCSHTWRLAGTRKPGYVPELRSKPSTGIIEAPAHEPEIKKPKKGKEKGKGKKKRKG